MDNFFICFLPQNSGVPSIVLLVKLLQSIHLKNWKIFPKIFMNVILCMVRPLSFSSKISPAPPHPPSPPSPPPSSSHPPSPPPSHLHLLIPGDQSLVELFVLAPLLLLIVQIKCQVKCLNHFHPLHKKKINLTSLFQSG